MIAFCVEWCPGTDKFNIDGGFIADEVVVDGLSESPACLWDEMKELQI